MLVLRTGIQALCSSAGEDTLREDVRGTRRLDSTAVGSDLTDEHTMSCKWRMVQFPIAPWESMGQCLQMGKGTSPDMPRNRGYLFLLLTATHSIAGAKAW